MHQMKYANDTRLKTNYYQVFVKNLRKKKLELSFTNAKHRPFDSLDDSLRV